MIYNDTTDTLMKVQHATRDVLEKAQSILVEKIYREKVLEAENNVNNNVKRPKDLL